VCPFSSSETGDEETRDKIRWKKWELRQSVGLGELRQRGRRFRERKKTSLLLRLTKYRKRNFFPEEGQNHHIDS